MIWENIVLAASSLKANKTRSLLTMLGIIIGISSVIAIVSIGSAMQNYINSSLASFGTANITIAVQERGKKNTDYDRGPVAEIVISGKTPSSSDLITERMINDFKTRYKDSIHALSISYSSGSATVKDMELYANVSISGINGDYAKANSIKLLAGREIIVAKYKSTGMKGLCDKRSGGNHRRYSEEKEAEIFEEVKTEAQKGVFPRISEIKAKIEEKVGEEIPQSTFYEMVHRQKGRKVKPGGQNPGKADQKNRKCKNVNRICIQKYMSCSTSFGLEACIAHVRFIKKEVEKRE